MTCVCLGALSALCPQLAIPYMAMFTPQTAWFIVWGSPELTHPLTSYVSLRLTRITTFCKSVLYPLSHRGQIICCALYSCHDNPLKDASARLYTLSHFILFNNWEVYLRLRFSSRLP